ncbi:SNF2 domain-containing protein / helicase domain-containing protein / zinc finger protein-related [Raphanus sativus]|uniref:Helicase-like transcription factor CHR28 n=1 Tax=Raphanus sativus TaxID=3726 RepID=A0A6J0JQ59_RAPSA|nr:helicase-like transcription factor CHR28 [Raphanus sativus]KAJ4890975.1 SNF2 domain-containing protein / helicase domain-containing protein / zinc finger protein-related [Raphanus sativus]
MMNYPIYISSSSDDEDDEVQEKPMNSQQPETTTTIIKDERRIYEAALQDLNQPKTEKDLPHGVLSVPLMRHQKIALEWMRQKERSYNNCLGGILADDQGLGKTISIIALILLQKLKSQSRHSKRRRSRRSGGTLVVCPASVVKQWAKELDDKVSLEHKLSVLVYHGSKRTNDPVELAKYDVVVTTYALVTNEVLQPSSSQRRFSGALGRVRWSRVVLDEAQTIKNHQTQVAKACSGLNAKRRWCLSGTPIQNEVWDLFSYFRFLRYHPYAERCFFSQRIMVPIKNNRLRGYKKLQAILRAILLRRTKDTLLDGQPILHLPPKTVTLTKAEFSPEEFAFYKGLEAASQSEFKAYADAGTVSKNYVDILVMLLRLRQACDHPQLVRSSEESAVEPARHSDFTSTKIKAVMETLQSLGKQVKTLVFSQWTGMLDLVEYNFVKNGVTFRRLDGTMSLAARDKAVKEFNNDPSVQVMLMSLKAGNLGLNMVSASHVIILDLWWNPTTEDQAIDRAHRIGQTQAVTVTRITIKNTVEERILALQETKRIVVASALGEDPGELSATRLTEQDLGYLFFGVKQETL